MSETNKVGRPQKNIDWNAVETMLSGGATGSDIADVLGMSRDHFYRRVQQEKGYHLSSWQAQCRAVRNHRLRAAQIREALGYWDEKVETQYTIMPDGGRVPTRQTVTKFYHPPSVPMLIFLGKNVLGQSDNPKQANDNNSQFGNIPNYRMIGDGKEDQESIQLNTRDENDQLDE